MTNGDLTRHPDELLDAWLDGRLEADERRGVDEHLADCERCRTQLEVLRATVAAVRTGLPPAPAPAGLAHRIRAALDAEDAAAQEPDAGSARAEAEPATVTAMPGPEARRPASRWRWAAAAAAVVAVAVIAYWLAPGTHRPPPPRTEPSPRVEPGPSSRPADLLGAVAASYAELDRGQLPAAFATTDPATVEKRWQQASLAFPARVLDLGAMGIHLAGGGATTLAGWPAAVTAYRGSDAGLLVCWMLEATVADLPAGAEIHRKNGFEFHVYQRGARTLVFWEEGEVLCALAGTGDPQTVLGLAVAKAMAPAARGSA